MSLIAESRTEQIKRIRDIFLTLAWTVARQFSQELQDFGLTLPQFVALVSLIARQHPCPMGDLTKATLQDAPTMTGIIDRLVKMKFVQRTRSQTDRRVVLVQATPAGLELVKRIRNKMDDDIARYVVLADDEPADLDRLLADFERLLEYTLRLHLERRHALGDADSDAEIEKLRLFLRDPFCQTKPEAEEQTAVQ